LSTIDIILTLYALSQLNLTSIFYDFQVSTIRSFVFIWDHLIYYHVIKLKD